MAAISHARRGPHLGSRPMAVRVPSGFGWTPSWYVREWAPGLFATSINAATLKLATATIRYVDLATGADGNTGLVKASPKKSIWSAINVGANDTIYVKGAANPSTPTVYPYDNAWRLPSLANTNVIAVSDFDTLAPGYVVSSTGNVAGDSLLGAWASTGGGTPNTYVATLAAAPTVTIDGAFRSTSENFARLALQSSIATVDANPGSYWHNAGNLYVRTSDSRAPDVNVRALKSATNGHESVAISIYVERVSFEGGNAARAFYLQNIVGATFVDCTFSDCDGLGVELSTVAAAATHTVTLIRCRGVANKADGLGGTATGAGTIINWAEIGCDGSANSGAGTDQGSSLHKTVGNGAVVGIRVGGAYHGNKTDGIADVGGMQTWCLGTRIYQEAIGAYLGGAGSMWLHGCSVIGSTGTADLVTDDAGGTIYTASTVYRTTSGVGTVASYTP